MLIFQYGSNLSSQRLNSPERLQGQARVVDIAHTVTGWRFGFPVWGGINDCAAAGILPGGDKPVWGVIYEIPDTWVVHGDGVSLDRIENEGVDYDRGPIDLQLTDGREPPAPVHTYHPRDPRHDRITQWHYVEHILAGVDEHGLPEYYRRRLERAIIDNNPSLAKRLAVSGR